MSKNKGTKDERLIQISDNNEAGKILIFNYSFIIYT